MPLCGRYYYSRAALCVHFFAAAPAGIDFHVKSGKCKPRTCTPRRQSLHNFMLHSEFSRRSYIFYTPSDTQRSFSSTGPSQRPRNYTRNKCASAFHNLLASAFVNFYLCMRASSYNKYKRARLELLHTSASRV
jgi:hypothetical protein